MEVVILEHGIDRYDFVFFEAEGGRGIEVADKAVEVTHGRHGVVCNNVH